jgi:hypothetical protein
MRQANNRQFLGRCSSQGVRQETITDVNLVNVVGRAVAGVGVPNTKQQPLQGTTKLHGFVGCQFYSVSVDSIKVQVHNETGAAVALGDTAEGGDAKAAKVFETWERTKFADSFIRNSVQKPLRAKSAILSRTKSMW